MKPIRRISARKYRGLGDVVERVAKPIARVIDRVAGTDIEHCEGCASRRAALNHALPFGPQDPPPPASTQAEVPCLNCGRK
jgi:hypothetical protein